MKSTKRKAPPPKAVVTIELANGVPMEFRLIPPPAHTGVAEPGAPLSFMMGSRDGDAEEQPRHRVVIPQPFYVGTFPVTQQQFAIWTASAEYGKWFETNRHLFFGNPERHRNEFPGNPQHPAENLTWHEARGFMEWLNARKLLPPELESYIARLPCEAEWEYACRAGTATEYANGDGEAVLEESGWFDGNAGTTTHPVGMKEKNPWGLRDMHGNVWEWCEDVYDLRAYAKREHPWPARAWTQEDSGSDVILGNGTLDRVLRGGSWFSPAEGCRAAYRDWRHPGLRNWNRGFRVFLALPGPAEPVKPVKRAQAAREREGGTTDRATGRPQPRGPKKPPPAGRGRPPARATSEPAAPRNKSIPRKPPSP
jgi:formylglycine-generating enzyme required for sulfatase activity